MLKASFKKMYMFLMAISFWPNLLVAQQIKQTGFLESISSQIETKLSQQPTEKIYIHFDRSFYFLEEYSFFKAYVVDSATLLPTTLLGVLYVDWLDSLSG